MSTDDILRAEAAAREGWRSNFIRRLLDSHRRYLLTRERPCDHDWRAIADGITQCIRCGQRKGTPDLETVHE